MRVQASWMDLRQLHRTKFRVFTGEAHLPIAALVGISRRFVYKWAQRFLYERVAGLIDRPGRGTQRHAALAQGTAAILAHGEDPSSTGTHGMG